MVRSSLLLPLLAAASAVQALDRSPKTVAGAYIFELEDGQDASDFFATTDADDEAVTRMNLNYTLFRGLSIQFTNLDTADAKAAKLAQLSSVRNMWPVRTYGIPEPEVLWTGQQGRDYVDLKKRQLGNDTFSTHVQTQVDKLHRDGVTGKGIKVAVIDTGIDYLHPALGGCFGPECLVSFGTDFVGDDYNGFNDQTPDNDPIDNCNGHGTHVAGIIAAQSNPFGFLGTAPGVTLGAYRVFGCTGQVGNDVLIAAYNRAFEDGSNIITASIGGPSGWTDEPWAATVSRIVDAGVPCTVSAGNSGDQGIFFAATAASGRHVTAIASFDNSITPALLIENSFTVAGGAPRKFTYTPGEPDAWAGVELPLWTPSTDPTSVAALGCDPYPAGTDLSGKIVLVKRGTCTFVAKAQNAAAAGAKYLMLYNSSPGATAVSVTAAPGILAVGMTTPAQGAVWLEAIAAGSEVVLQMTDPAASQQILTEAVNTATGGSVSSFSSWGPNWDAHQKPQFGAIGGNVLSLYPRALGSYAVLSGTSMSCPQMAGIVALIAEVRKTFDPATIENLLSAHANPVKFNYGTGPSALLAPVSQQGAGLVQAYEAAHATTLLSHSSLSFNDTDNFIPELNFTIKNTGSADVSFDLTNVGAATAYTFAAAGDITPALFPNNLTADFATLAFSESKVSVPAGGEVTVLVTPTPPAALVAARLPVWSGYIALNGSDGSSMSLPYMGIGGSLHSHVTLDQVLMTTSVSAKAEAYAPVASNYTYVLPPPGTANETQAILPALAISMAFGSAMVRADLVPLTTCPPNITREVFGIKTLGQPRSFPLLYVSRGISATSWDGQMDDGSYVPAGKYKFVIKSLRVFGDASKLEEYDIAETDPFRVIYGAVNATVPLRR